MTEKEDRGKGGDCLLFPKILWQIAENTSSAVSTVSGEEETAHANSC